MMSKHRADDNVSDLFPKHSRDWQLVISSQVEYILNNSFISSISCESCASSGEDCVMDCTHRYSKCALRTRQRHSCHREFHTGKEWDLLQNAETKIANDLAVADDELELLEPEFNHLQTRLLEVQNKIKTTLARHACLRKQQKFLKEHDFWMSEHDSELLQIFDEKSSEQPDSPVIEVQQLAATSNNPNFNEMLKELAQMPPSFWKNADLFADDISSSSGGIPSNSQ